MTWSNIWKKAKKSLSHAFKSKNNPVRVFESALTTVYNDLKSVPKFAGREIDKIVTTGSNTAQSIAGGLGTGLGGLGTGLGKGAAGLGEGIGNAVPYIVGGAVLLGGIYFYSNSNKRERSYSGCHLQGCKRARFA
jgi:phage-related protein